MGEGNVGERDSDGRDGAWFHPHLYGIGCSWPAAWQGWATLVAFVGLMIANVRLNQDPVRPLVAVILIGSFLLIAAHKTRGGWRWRWGRL